MYEDKRYKEHMSSAAPSISYSSSKHFHSVSSEYLIEKLHTILSNHKDQRSYAFVTADIQDFRLINEYCGYETGSNILDTVLRWNSTVQMLSTHFRVQLTTTKYVFICSQKLAVKVKIESAEVLVRWNKAPGVVWTPDKFLPVLEETGDITTIDYYVYEKAFAWLKERRDSGLPVVPIS